MSIKSKFRALRERIVRDPLPPEDVAAGWALGMFVGCAIPFGMQLIISIPLAIMMRVSKVGATLGTLITNPFTVFFIYPAQTYLANQIFFGGRRSFAALSHHLAGLNQMGALEALRTLVKLGGDVIVCFFLGGMLLAIVLTPITYFAVKRMVVTYRKHPLHLKSRKRNDLTRQAD